MKMKTVWRLSSAGVFGACTAAMMICTTGESLAAEATASSKTALPEMVVTAQKRKQKLEEVPISVTAFDEEALALREFNQLEDLAYAAPNVNIASSTDARTTQFTMRGITGQTLFPGAESSVGIFVDGVYVNNPIAQNFDILDVERVEVLRGPQGTLYGKNTTAGAINVISRKPGDELAGSGSIQYGNYNDIRVKGSVEGPIVDGKLFGQLAATFHKRDAMPPILFWALTLIQTTRKQCERPCVLRRPPSLKSICLEIFYIKTVCRVCRTQRQKTVRTSLMLL